ncbi:MAG: trigger factor [Hyphomicrobiaceae bacterium]|nr:trigger factor [Hyphomicrobiaceae bacterium]
MQITEASSEGLRRTLKVVVGASELNDKLAARLDQMKDTVRLKGFRQGKVPLAHLRKVYGRSVMAEVVEQTLSETSQKALSDRNERPAMQPKIEVTEDRQEIEAIIDGKADLAYTMSFEVLPDITLADLATLTLKRPVAEVSDEATEKALAELAERNVTYTAAADRAAQDGDRLTIDFVGRIGDEAFEGGTGEDMQLVLGAGGFIPGFSEGLIGVKAGEERSVTANFPAEYQERTLAGKEAVFAVKVKEVAEPSKPAVDDDFAKTLGAEDLSALRTMIKARLGEEYEQIGRSKLKRRMFDALDKAHTFSLPPTLVDNEFEGIWKQVQEELKRANRTLADEGKTEDEARADYRRIAERRVRLGLVIAEIADRNKLEVSNDELRRAMVEQARQFPGQERMVYEYYEKTPGALADLRAPLLEEKVVNFVVELAKVEDVPVSVEELVKPDEDAD